MTIGERIKKRREELGISQEDLAIKLGYKNRSSINKIEQDKQNLRQSKIKAIADALETTPSYIMGWTETSSVENTTILDDLYDPQNKGKKWTWLNKKEQELITYFRSLDEDAQRKLVLILAFNKDKEQ